MSVNVFPTQLDKFWPIVIDAVYGLHQHEVAIGIKQVTEAVLTGSLTTAQTSESNFQAGRGDKGVLVAIAVDADKAGRDFIARAKRQLANSLGNKWTPAWAAVGFAAPSLLIPRTIGERQSLVFAMKGYFTANPGKENAPENVTAAEAGVRFLALKTARTNVLGADVVGLTQTRDHDECHVERGIREHHHGPDLGPARRRPPHRKERGGTQTIP